MSDREKYDGKLTESLINAVVRAELRQWVREAAGVTDAATGLLDGKTVCCERLSDGRHVFPCPYREQPTDTERAAAWARDHDESS